MSLAKDINGDGVPDLIIGAPYISRFEESGSYIAVMYGHNINESFPSTISVSGFNGINGFVINQE
jgi:hypothetical protein